MCVQKVAGASAAFDRRFFFWTKESSICAIFWLLHLCAQWKLMLADLSVEAGAVIRACRRVLAERARSSCKARSTTELTTESAMDTAQVRYPRRPHSIQSTPRQVHGEKFQECHRPQGQPPLCRANLLGGFIGPFSSLLETRHCEICS